jgi:hypothetical protein
LLSLSAFCRPNNKQIRLLCAKLDEPDNITKYKKSFQKGFLAIALCKLQL